MQDARRLTQETSRHRDLLTEPVERDERCAFAGGVRDFFDRTNHAPREAHRDGLHAVTDLQRHYFAAGSVDGVMTMRELELTTATPALSPTAATSDDVVPRTPMEALLPWLFFPP